MQVPAGRLTALSRPIDLNVGSNRFAVFAALTVTAVALIVQLTIGDGASPAAAVSDALRYGLGAFLAWAIAREVAPDDTTTARLAVAAHLPMTLLGPPDVAPVLCVLVALRLTVRSTGRPPTRVDLALLVGLAAFAAMSTVGFVTALALAYAVHADRRAPDPADDVPSEITAAAIVAVALASTVVTRSFLTDWDGFTVGHVGVILAVVAATPRFRVRHVDARTDRGTPMWTDRVRRARRILLATLAVAVAWSGGEAVHALAPAAAAVVGIGLHQVWLSRPRHPEHADDGDSPRPGDPDVGPHDGHRLDAEAPSRRSST